MNEDFDPVSDSENSNSRNTWKKTLRTGITVLFFILIPALLYFLLKDLEWDDVKTALLGYSVPIILLGAAISLANFTLLSSFDLIGRYQTQHKLPVSEVLPVAFVCYTFNLNFGAWVGGIALRYRLYSRLGLDVATITSILSISLVTNWLGYMIVAGTLFSINLISLPENWGVSELALQMIGVALLALSAAYFVLCQFSGQQTWSWRKVKITFPTLKIALLQATMGTTNWCLIGLLLYLLMPDGTDYPTILAVFMVSSIAGVITHIPAGLGVIETVFISLLRNDISTGTLLAVILAYRALYYLLPLSLGVIMYFFMEKRAG